MRRQKKQRRLLKSRDVENKLVGGEKTRLAHQRSTTKKHQRRRDIRNAKA